MSNITEENLVVARYFSVEGCELRIGVYESFDTLCIYLESDAFGSGLERNFWVKYRIAILNQKYPDRTDWKESSICTKTWNNSVLQFMKVTGCSSTCRLQWQYLISACLHSRTAEAKQWQSLMNCWPHIFCIAS